MSLFLPLSVVVKLNLKDRLLQRVCYGNKIFDSGNFSKTSVSIEVHNLKFKRVCLSRKVCKGCTCNEKGV